MSHYPKWIYHHTKPAKIVHSKEEHETHEGWEETPAAFIEESDEKTKKPKADKDEAEQGSSSEPKKKFAAMKKDDLVFFLIGQGIEAKELDGLNKAELVAKAEAA